MEVYKFQFVFDTEHFQKKIIETMIHAIDTRYTGDTGIFITY